MGFLGRGRGPALPHRGKAGRRVVVIQSDPHAGHRLGLCNPKTLVERVDDDGDWCEVPLLDLPGTGLTETQERLWRIHREHVDNAIQIADGCRLDVLQAGDSTSGVKYPAGNMAVEPVDQIAIAAANLEPWRGYGRLGAMRFFSGTPAHSRLGLMTAEAILAGKMRDAGIDAKALHHARLTVEGKRFDVAHHGPPPGSRTWLEGNVARYYLRSAVWEDRALGLEPADYYVRGHYHCWVEEELTSLWHGERVENHLLVIPSLSGMTDHARQFTRSKPVLINGLVVFEIEDRRGTVTPMLDIQDLRTEETL